MKIKLIFFFVFAACSISLPQRVYKISVQADGKETTLSFVLKNGIEYVSAKELGSLLGASLFYNAEASKIEIKFGEYSLKFTAKDQFVILTKKSDGSQSIIQIPMPALLMNDDVFIPLIYCLDFFNLGYGKRLVYDSGTKNLNATEEAFSNEEFFSQKSIVSENKTTVAQEPVKPKGNSKYDISAVSIEEKSNGTLIRLKANKKIPIPRHSISNGTLYIFIAGVTLQPDIINVAKPAGLVKKIKKTTITPKNVQLEFTLADGYSDTDAFQDVESNDILITINNKLFSNPPANVEEAKSKWIFDAVVIDAGHGGKDPGAIGVTGVKEKDVNLEIALKLGKLIEKNLPGIRVIYTRKTDEFIELYKRGKIANESGGKLFISIHCNSTQAKDISYRGFEVYLLRPGRTRQAIAIAEFENSVIKYEDNPKRYQALTDENFILVSMAHSQYMRYSEKFSDILNQEWKNGVKIPALGIKQAGFYVLVGASMPGVLIETGFLSNRKDEAYLASKSGQSEIALTIFNSIKNYKQNYDKELKN